MQPLLISALSVLVFFHSLSRFREIAVTQDPRDIAGPANAFTTSPNYWGGAVIYGIVFVATYIGLLQVFRNTELTRTLIDIVAQLLPQWDVDKWAQEIPKETEQVPVWLASLFTFAIPSIPLLSRTDRAIRAKIQRFVGIPEFAWHLADRLESHRDYRLLGDVGEHFRRIITKYLPEQDLTADQLHDAQRCDERYVRMLYLLELLEDWAAADTRYKRFAEQQTTTYQAILNKLDSVKLIAINRAADQDSRIQGMLDATIDDAWLHLRRYVACAAMACERSAEGIEQRLRLLGFSRSDEVPYTDFFSTLALTFVLTFAATQAVVLGWDLLTSSLMMNTVDMSTRAQFYLQASSRAAQIAVLHALAIAIAMLRLGSRMPQPWMRAEPWRDLALGWVSGTLFAMLLPMSYTTFVPAVEGADAFWRTESGDIRLLRSALIGIPVGFAAFSFVRLITGSAFLITGRMSDSVRQGLYTALPTLAVASLAAVVTEEAGGSNPLLTIALATTVAFVIGAVIGAILPVRYRRKREFYRVTHDQIATVVGAGVAGLACARYLHDHGFQVQVLEATATAGGRIRSTYFDDQEFDIGAQVFQETPREFTDQVQKWAARGLVQPWNPRVVRLGTVNGNLVSETLTQGETRYTGVSRMDSLITQELLHHYNVSYRTRVTHVAYDKAHTWSVFSGTERVASGSHYLVLAVPERVAGRILGSIQVQTQLPELESDAATNSAWVCAVSFASELVSRERNIGEYQIGLFHQVSDVLNRAYCISTKPGREADTQRWVMVADDKWSAAHRDASEGEIVNAMLNAFWQCSGYEEEAPMTSPRGFLWDDAAPDGDPGSAINDARQGRQIVSQPFHFDDKSGVGLCGDWCASFGVGYAWTSGQMLAKRIVEDTGVF